VKPIKLRARLLNCFQRIFRLLFIVDVDFGETIANVCERSKVAWLERNLNSLRGYGKGNL